MVDNNYLLFVDEAPVCSILKKYFNQFGFRISQLDDLYALNKQTKLPFAILVHWSIVQRQPHQINALYNKYPVPLIVFHDSPDEEVCITALESGADDFLVKPLFPREVHARINAITKRLQRSVCDKKMLVFSNWRLLPASRQVLDEKNQELQLSVGEYDLLYTFVQQPQKILNREFLLQLTKQSELNLFDRRIDVQISRLRQKIEPNVKKPVLIKTIRNKGYLFNSPVSVIKL